MTMPDTLKPDELVLKPCPFCGAHPHHGQMKVEYCQLHGDAFQRFRVWCPHSCAEKIGASREQAIIAWNRRAPTTAEAALVKAREEETMEVCDWCQGSGYGGHPDSGHVCHKCKGQGGIAALRNHEASE